jgi:hypothetical protein
MYQEEYFLVIGSHGIEISRKRSITYTSIPIAASNIEDIYYNSTYNGLCSFNKSFGNNAF